MKINVKEKRKTEAEKDIEFVERINQVKNDDEIRITNLSIFSVLVRFCIRSIFHVRLLSTTLMFCCFVCDRLECVEFR